MLRSAVRGSIVFAVAVLLGACAAGGSFPRVIADAEPIPGGCPPSICPQHTPTQPPPPTDEPEPQPTATASKPGQPAPKPPPGGTTKPPAAGPTPTTSGAPTPVVPPVAGKNRFAAFPFPGVPFAQAFPIDPPPAPEPLPIPPSGGMVALAAALAAGVAAAASITARRRAVRSGRPGSLATGGPTT